MLLFLNGSCIEENCRTSLHRFREAKIEINQVFDSAD